MIKFVASDLDGTLLNKQGELPKEIFPLVARLSACGILFAPASGRQCANLELLFAPVADKVLFIAENGALVRRNGCTLHLDPIPAPLVSKTLQAVRAVEGLYPILCTADCAYIENDTEPFRSKVLAAYTNCREVKNLNEYILSAPVCKVSVYSEAGAKQDALKILPPLLNGLSVTLSGEHWCDVSSPTANKGTAVREIQRKLGFSPDECMAFGDHMNDIELLRACSHSRAVENAYPPVKESAEKIVPSNEEKGVLHALEELLNEQAGNS